MPKQKVSVEIYIDGAWTDLVTNNEVLASSPITITRGESSESSGIRPSTITLRLNNEDDKFRVSNPLSPLYGKAGRNTPIRISVGSVVRGIAEITSWQCGQTRDFRRSPKRGNAWTDIEAHGIFWRINQWTSVIESTMTKGIKSFTTDLSGAWPLEDTSETTVIANVVAGGYLGTFSTSGISFGETERPLGAASTMKVTAAGAKATGKFIKSNNSGWQISFAAKLASIPASATYEEMFTWSDSTGRRWTWEVNNANFLWSIYAHDGSLLDSVSSSYSGTEPNQWIRFRMKVTVAGAVVTYEPAWYVEGSSTPVGITDTFAGTTTGYLLNWTVNAGTYNLNSWYCSIFGLNDSGADIFNSGVIDDFNGHVGETVADRFDRILDDLGISHAISGTANLSEAMGAQPVDTLSEILREMADTEDALIYESKSAINLVMSLRTYRYNQTATTLDLTDDPSGFSLAPEEITDDLAISNLVTANNRTGGSTTIEDSTSVVGTQPPPDGAGEYKKTVEISIEDPTTRLAQIANWWLRRGTVSLPRYPQVVMNLNALGPSKISDIEDIDVGTVFEITNYREYSIRLQVIGYTETIYTHNRTITFNCIPDQQFDVGIYDSTEKRYDCATCTMSAEASSIATSLSLTFSSDESWSTTSTPYDLLIAGERVTVTTMGARSGSGPYAQTATVTRGTNGIRKVLPVGSEVSIANPGRYAL